MLAGWWMRGGEEERFFFCFRIVRRERESWVFVGDIRTKGSMDQLRDSRIFISL